MSFQICAPSDLRRYFPTATQVQIRSISHNSCSGAARDGETRAYQTINTKNHYDDRAVGVCNREGGGGGAGTEVEVYNEGPVYLYGLVYTSTHIERNLDDL